MSLPSSHDAGRGLLGPLGVVEVPPVTGLLLPWRLNGELRATIIVKASFAIVPEGPMALAQADDVVPLEVHYANSPARSVRQTLETAPRMPRCDVTLAGHAVAPEGQPVRWLSVRLAVFREHALLDKTIYVYGDDGGAASFDRIPLVYERAHGGLGFRENPLGTGILELSSKPNLVHPERPNEVACFAPISRTWPARRRLVGTPERKAADAVVPEIKDGFDWTYFLAAPADQRIDYLHGDEWIVLEGMSATLTRVRSRLPSARAEARVFGLPGVAEGAPIPLVADTLRIDADRMGCWVVWRADVAVPDEAALEAMRVMVGVETEGAPIAWPAAPTAPEAVIELDSEMLVPVGTVTIDEDEPAGDEAAKPVVPFTMGPQAAPNPGPAEPAQVTMGPQAAPNPGPAEPAQVTMGPQAVASPSPRPVMPPIPAARFGDTLAVMGDVGMPSMPFVRPMPTAPPPEWAPVSVRPPPQATPVMEARPITIDTGSIAARPEPESVVPTRRRVAAGKRSSTGIHLDHPPPLALGVIPWGLDPSRDCLAVIAKATCDIVPGEPAALRAEAEALNGDVFAEGADGNVCVHPSDLAPFKIRADVVAVGRAHAPPGGARSMEIALSFGHEGRAIARRIKVFGDRRWQRAAAGHAPSEPEVFSTIPVVYRRAFGGASIAANPDGVGVVDRFRDAGRSPPMPNLEDPDALLRVPSMRPPPACFAPMPLSWRQRAASAERRAPWPRFPEDLDWASYQSAPPSQRLPFLRGDEPFALTGMHRAHASLEGTLPGVSPRAFASRAGDRFEEVALRLDTVVIDADALKLTLVWRGVLLVESEALPDVEAVHLVMEQVGKEGMTLEAARDKLAAS